MFFNTSPARVASRAEDDGTDAVPADLDPHACPIISRHWFGIEPLHLGTGGNCRVESFIH